MITSILLTGVGGQGTILTTKILSAGLARMGYDVKMSEIHGMSQRGGTVNTQLKFGDKVYAPNIGEGEADVIVAFEKAEALRALPYLKKGGVILMDRKEIMPLSVLTGAAEYPHGADTELEKLVGVLPGPAPLRLGRPHRRHGAPQDGGHEPGRLPQGHGGIKQNPCTLFPDFQTLRRGRGHPAESVQPLSDPTGFKSNPLRWASI